MGWFMKLKREVQVRIMIKGKVDQQDQGTLKGKRSNIMRHKDVSKYCKKESVWTSKTGDYCHSHSLSASFQRKLQELKINKTFSLAHFFTPTLSKLDFTMHWSLKAFIQISRWYEKIKQYTQQQKRWISMYS